MIRQSISQTYDKDCSTCVHRVERHHSKREILAKPRRMHYVCLVEGKAITEHGTRMLHSEFRDDGKLEQEWRYECPCKFYDKEKGRWIPLDWEET